MEETTILLRRLRAGSATIAVLAVVAFGLAIASGADLRPLFMALAAAFASIVVAIPVANGWLRRARHRRIALVMEFIEHDSAPAFCTDETGLVFAQNRAATDRFGPQRNRSMVRALEPLFANPDAVVHRLRAAADGRPSAREDVVTRRGHMRVALHRIPGGCLWRLENLVDRAEQVDGIPVPMLTFGPSGTILHMSKALRARVGCRVRHLRDLFEYLPLQTGAVNRMKGVAGREAVRIVLSEVSNGRQDAFVIRGDEAPDGRVALDALPVALMRLDAHGDVIFSNRPARQLLPALGDGGERRFPALVEGLGRSVREWVGEAAVGRGLNRSEVVRVKGASSETYLQITLGRPLDDGEGGLIVVLNDATELKTMEAQFVQSQKMQAIGQLAGGVAHDFNNLLTAISGHCDLLLLRHGVDDEDHADLLQITQNANRAAALVGQLLAFSRKQTLRMERLDLRDTLSDLAHLLNRLVGERVALRLLHDPALLPIRGDRRQLEQVLMNLVVNARDAMPDGGDIRIETCCRYLDGPMSRDRVTVPAGQFVVVTVADEGHGIPADQIARIFEPFFTTKRPGEGTGLGLSMAYGIVKQSGGYIFVDSTPSKGTVFSLYFPADLSQDDAVPPVAPAALASHRGDDGAGEAQSPVQDARRSGAREAVAPTGPKLQTEAPGRPDDERPASRDAVADLLRETSAMAEGAVVAGSPAIADEGAGEEPMRDETRSSGDGARTSEGGGSDDPATGTPGRWEGRAAADPGRGSGSDGADSPGRRTVLLVEDEAPVRAFATRALRLRGYEVIEAASAEEALDRLADPETVVDLFVTDVMMPGLDGPTWVRKALETRPDVRTIFISGYTQDALSETSAPVPNAVFLAKPFSLSELTRTVEHTLA